MKVAGIVAVATITIVFSVEAGTSKYGISSFARDCCGGPPVPCPPPPLLCQDHDCHQQQHPYPVFHLPAVPVMACDTFTIHKSEAPKHTLLRLLLPIKQNEKTTACVSPAVSLICNKKHKSKTTLLGTLFSLF